MDLSEMTKTAIGVKAREIANPYKPVKRTGPVFTSDWISDLFLNNYWWCKENKIRPASFQWVWGQLIPGSFYTHIFSAYLPNHGWRKIALTKAIAGLTKEKSIADNVDAQFRQEGTKFYPKPRLVDKCEKCNVNFADHVHHSDPTFAEIYNKCIKLITKADINSYNFLTNSQFLLNNHPAIILCQEEHSKAKYLRVCKPCHYTFPKEIKKEKIVW